MFNSLTAVLEQQPPRRRLLLVTAVACFIVAGLLIQVRLPQSDLAVYRGYGLATLHSRGHLALPREYPALAGLVFALVAALPGNFTVAFGVAMGIALVGLVVVGGRVFDRWTWAYRALLYLGIGTIGVALGRYDLLPVIASTAAVGLAMRSRWGSAWGAAALGAALKIFPLLLLPGFFIAEWRATGRPPWRRLMATGVVAAAFLWCQSLLAPGTVWSPVRYELRRGFEVSSLGGTLTGLLDPARLTWKFAFGSWQVVGVDRGAITALLSVLTVGGLLTIWALAWRERLSVPAVGLAVLTVSVLTDHALAPQYLIWLAPLWALWPLRSSWIVSAALTTLVFPVAYFAEARWLPAVGLHAGMYPALMVAAARNAVLVVGSLIWLRSELRHPQQFRAVPQSARSASARPSPDPLPLTATIASEGGRS